MTQSPTPSENPNASAGPAGAPPAADAPPPAAAGAAGAAGLVTPESPDAKTMAMLAHLLAIFTGFIGPLIIWLIKKDQSPFVNQQGKEALNWAITVVIGFVGCVILGAILAVIFLPLLFLVWLLYMAIGICNLVFGIISTIAVNKGEAYRYPICLRLIK